MPQKLNFEKDPLLTDNGILQLPKAPGFGIEFNERAEKKEVMS
jgi:hypothetical protein